MLREALRLVYCYLRDVKNHYLALSGGFVASVVMGVFTHCADDGKGGAAPRFPWLQWLPFMLGIVAAQFLAWRDHFPPKRFPLIPRRLKIESYSAFGADGSSGISLILSPGRGGLTGTLVFHASAPIYDAQARLLGPGLIKDAWGDGVPLERKELYSARVALGSTNADFPALLPWAHLEIRLSSNTAIAVTRVEGVGLRWYKVTE